MKKEVFKAGQHTDSKGNKRAWTIADLDKIVTNFNESLKKGEEIPVVIGHPTTNAPAYGWVKTLTRDGESLYAEFRDMDDAFVDLVKQGRYKNTSISLDSNFGLRHIGFLGATAPAVKGLKQVEFSNPETFTLIEYAEQPPAQQDPAQKTTKEIDLDALLKAIRTSLSAEVAAKVESIIKNATNNFSQKDTEMEKRIEFLEKQNRDLQYENYFNSKVTAGELIPAQKESFRKVYDGIMTNMEFSEDRLTVLNGFISQFPKHNLMNEFASAGVDKTVTDEIQEIVKSTFGA